MKPKWGQVCRENLNQREPFRNPQWWTCDYRRFVASAECAFVGRGGEVYDESRVFSSHGIGFQRDDFKPEPNSRGIGGHHKAVAHHIYSTYPTATGHFFNQVTRLFWLIMTLPADVPILIPSFGLSDQLVKILTKVSWFNYPRICR